MDKFDARAELHDSGAYPLAMIVAMALAAVIAVGLLPTGNGVVEPDMSLQAKEVTSPTTTSRQRIQSLPTAPTEASVTAPPIATPRIAVAPSFSWDRSLGLVGLPPKGARPSTPEVGELVDSYWVGDHHPPYVGAARLYADGRLIWNRYYDGPYGLNAHSTGYIEQRLTSEGVELVRSQASRPAKDPARLPEWLPLDAWKDRTPRPYVPSGYGVCLWLINPLPDPSQPGPIERSQLLDMLPNSVSSLLRDRESAPADELEADCAAQTTEEARILDSALRDAGSDQDESTNRFVLQHSLEVPGAGGVEVWLVFEPRFPHGFIGCSACG